MNNMASSSSSEDSNGGVYVVRVNTWLRIENSDSGLDDGTILYRTKRLNQDSYRLTGADGDILALRSTNGGRSSGGSAILTSSLLVIAVLRKWILS